MNKQSVLLLMLFVYCLGFVEAQHPAKYWICFTDKNNSSYSINRPEAFLSPRAIEKRKKFNIEITEEDLPVNQDYIDAVMKLAPKMIHYTTSKWHNGITVYCEEENFEQKVKSLPFVKDCQTTIHLKNTGSLTDSVFIYRPQQYVFAKKSDFPPYKDLNYGLGYKQLSINNIHWLHRLGFLGEGVLMMVLDGGFDGIDSIAAFKKLRQENRLHGARNFVNPTINPMLSGSHGTNVLGCIASYLPDTLIGSAPMVSVYLAKTEDGRTENKIEEDNWVAAIEWADSLGCDVINSSLGYTTFDDTTMSYSTQDLNGKTSRASLAASIAASKGLIICNSAGNSGGSKWKYNGIPSDAADILTVAAIDTNSQRAFFSSYGYVVDQKIKPDVAAVGSNAVSINPAGAIEYVSGTSFSSPLLSGMVACLWQAFPEKSNMEIINKIRESGSCANNPNNKLGYGIADFFKAYNYLLSPNTYQNSDKQAVEIPSFVAKKRCLPFTLIGNPTNDFSITVTLSNGKTVFNQIIHVDSVQQVIVKKLRIKSKRNFDFATLSIKANHFEAHYLIGMEK